jgi:rRNA biogenesis protein RRP5
MYIGMKILGQIISIQPLAVIISLSNQLFAHVPITHISSQLTNILESVEEGDDDSEFDEDTEGFTPRSKMPKLIDIFIPGQYVRAVVTAIYMPGSSDVSAIGKSRDEVARASRRVELSLVPARVNAGVQKEDLRAGFVRASLADALLMVRLLSCFYPDIVSCYQKC